MNLEVTVKAKMEKFIDDRKRKRTEEAANRLKTGIPRPLQLHRVKPPSIGDQQPPQPRQLLRYDYDKSTPPAPSPPAPSQQEHHRLATSMINYYLYNNPSFHCKTPYSLPNRDDNPMPLNLKVDLTMPILTRESNDPQQIASDPRSFSFNNCSHCDFQEPTLYDNQETILPTAVPELCKKTVQQLFNESHVQTVIPEMCSKSVQPSLFDESQEWFDEECGKQLPLKKRLKKGKKIEKRKLEEREEELVIDENYDELRAETELLHIASKRKKEENYPSEPMPNITDIPRSKTAAIITDNPRFKTAAQRKQMPPVNYYLDSHSPYQLHNLQFNLPNYMLPFSTCHQQINHENWTP